MVFTVSACGVDGVVSLPIAIPTRRYTPPAPLEAPTATETPPAADPTLTATFTPTASPTPAEIVHVVQPGDTLDSIARQYGASVAALAAANHLTVRDPLLAGMTLTVPPDIRQAFPTPDSRVSYLPPNAAVIGYSTLNYPILAYRFGDGRRNIVFVGGLHGGYEWNTILLAYAVIDNLDAHPDEVSPALSVYVVPSANPDGQFAVTGTFGRFTPQDVVEDTTPGRFNGHHVDLNRNWDCAWQPVGYWGEQEVGTGSGPFSEIENRILRDFIMTLDAEAVVFWHSAFDGVFAGGCTGRFAPAQTLAGLYSDASGYPRPGAFSSYPVTGDSTDWLSLQGIPAITVELVNHTDLNWERNLAGLRAVLDYYGSEAGITLDDPLSALFLPIAP